MCVYIIEYNEDSVLKFFKLMFELANS